MLTINTITVITSLVSIVVIIFSTSFVLYKDPRSQVNRYYAFWAITGLGVVTGMLLTYWLSDSPYLLLISRFLQVSTTLYLASYLTLSYVFPKPEKRVRLFPVMLQLIPAFLTSLVILFTDLNLTAVYFEDGVIVRKYGIFFNYYLAVDVLYFFLGTVNFIRRYLNTEIRVYRLQMRYFFLAIFFGMGITIILSLILPRFFNFTLLYGISPSITTALGVGALFYSIVAYNLMDIATVIHKTMMYSIISAAIFIPIVAIVYLHQMKYPWIGQVPLEVMVLSLVILFILYTSFIQPLIDRAFKRKQYAFENVVDDFIRKVGSIREVSTIISESVKLLSSSLSLRKTFFYIYNTDTRQYEVTVGSKGIPQDQEPEPVDRFSTIVRWFTRNTDIITLDRVYSDDLNFAEIRSDMAEFYTANAFRLVIPVYHDRRLIGLLCLGEKESLADFTLAELEKLAFFQKECNGMISTALLYEEGIKKQMVSRTRDLSSYILSRSIPPFLPNYEGIRFGGFMIPRFAEGADYFDFIRMGSQGIGMIVTDMQGYGVPQSLYSVILRAAFQSCINDAPSSYNVIKNLNQTICDYNEEDEGNNSPNGVNAFYAFYDVKSSRLMYTNAGYQPLDVFRVETRVFDSFDSEGTPLGMKRDANYGIGRTNLMKGDIGVFYSRSLIASKNQHGEEFGLMRIRTIIRDHRNNHPTEIAKKIQDSFQGFLGLSSPLSDVLLLVFRIV